MSLNISPELERQIAAHIASGAYNSANEVVGASLRLLEDQDFLFERRKAQLNLKIQKGLDSLAAGKRNTPEEVKAYMAKAKQEFYRGKQQPV